MVVDVCIDGWGSDHEPGRPRDTNSFASTLRHVYTLPISPQLRQTPPSSPNMNERSPVPYRCSALPQLPHRMVEGGRDAVGSYHLAFEQLLVKRLRDDGTICIAHGPTDRWSR
jgi:hypothetical protein